MLTMYDISMTIHEDMQVFNDILDKKPKLRNVENFQTGSVHETLIQINAHTGTHLDAPLHMLEGGKTIETIPLESLVGPARVLDLTHVEDHICKADLEALSIQAGEWVLFKTKNSFTDQFEFDFVYLEEDGARYLQERGIRGVGTDGLGIERSQPNFATHRTLLGSDILIAEGLRLKDVPPGNYFFVLAPLKLTGIEAAPARAFLIGNPFN